MATYRMLDMDILMYRIDYRDALLITLRLLSQNGKEGKKLT